MFPFRAAAFALASGLSLAACSTYGNYGNGYGYNGYGYNGYGSGSRVSLGYSSSPYWGWNSGYYYPGAGSYVYDSYRRPYRWNRTQQTYWTGRQTSWRNQGVRRQIRENWRDFRQDRRQDRRQNRRDDRRDRRD